jgi:hypothetical protein
MDIVFKKILYIGVYLRTKLICKKKIKQLYNYRRSLKGINKISYSKIIQDHKSDIKNYFNKKADIRWINTYIAVSGIISPDYVPEDIYYLEIEPRLNDYTLSRAYSDKNFYEKYFYTFQHIFPTSVLRKIHGTYFDSQFNRVNNEDISSILKKENKLIFKPSLDSGGGTNIKIIDLNTITETNGFDSFIKTLSAINYSWVLQSLIIQHPFFSKFNYSSVNTVRLLTYRSVITEEVHVIQGVLRIGKEGSYVDNQAAGGFACGIDLDSGKLNSFVTDKLGSVYGTNNDIDFKEERYIPRLSEMKEIAKSLAASYNYFRLISFDFCLDSNNKIRLIEINTKNHEINFYQFNNGPLFKGFKEEIYEFCTESQKSFVLDYYLTK